MAIDRTTKRATLVDVAKAAGVSVSTASVVLNGKKTSIAVSERTRDKILAAARQLRYEPNVLARAFVQQKSNTIGIVIGDPSGYADAEKVRGAASFLDRRGYTVLTSSDDVKSDFADAHLKAFLSKRIDGLIVMDAYHRIPDSCFAELADEDVPVVLVERDCADSRIPAVHVDDYGGTRALTEHLIEHGHKRIGFIGGPAGTKPVSRSLRAYNDVLADAGIAANEDWVVGGDWLSSSGYVGMERLLEREPRVTAVLASNDAMALGAIRAAHDRGLRVPEDIAIVGFDNIAVLAPYSIPALTTVDNPLFLVGRTAAELLYRRMIGRDCPDTVVLPVDLVVRESCGCGEICKRSGGLDRNSARQARMLADGGWVHIADQVVSAVWGDVIYVQDPDGASGIAVSYCPAVSSLRLSPGDVLSVTGCLSTFAGHRLLRDPRIQVTGHTVAPHPTALAAPGAAGSPGAGALVELAGEAVCDTPGALPARYRLRLTDGTEVGVWSMESDLLVDTGESIRVVGVLEETLDGQASILAARVERGRST